MSGSPSCSGPRNRRQPGRRNDRRHTQTKGDTCGIAFSAGTTIYKRVKANTWKLTVNKEPVEGLFVVESGRFVQFGDAAEG